MRALIQWCNETAKHEQSEPYRILSKAALRAIAAKQPEGLAELAAVYGVGEEKPHVTVRRCWRYWNEMPSENRYQVSDGIASI